jgi:hypothetical protein
MIRRILFSALCVLSCAVGGRAAVVDGRWEGRMKSPEGEDMQLIFSFKVDGDKLSGSVETPDGDLPISDGKVKGDEFSFVVDAGGNSIDHRCKVSGDTISMKILFSEERTVEVTLTRAAKEGAAAPAAVDAAAPAADPSGYWKWSFTTPNGDTFAVALKLEFKNGQLTGVYTGRLGEAPISDASFKDGAIAFSVVRELDGNKFVIKYQGRLEGDALKGSIELPGFGDGGPTKIDWNASRAR